MKPSEVSQSDCTLSLKSQARNFAASVLCLEFLSTITSSPPKTDARVLPFGRGATDHFPLMPAALRLPTDQGPEVNIASLPAMKGPLTSSSVSVAAPGGISFWFARFVQSWSALTPAGLLKAATSLPPLGLSTCAPACHSQG